MNDIPDTHPRAASLRIRERLVVGLHAGIVTETGLIAHGRGEALDYLLGERTHPFAEKAIEAAAATLRLARHPVITLNGNVVALIGPELPAFADRHPWLNFEINIFHHTPERARRITTWLRSVGLTRILDFGESAAPVILPGTDSKRRFMHPDGCAIADVVLVALEDGDRCKALVENGKQVIAIDLNPLSRTAQLAQVTVVDELTRMLPALNHQLLLDETVPKSTLKHRMAAYDNQTVLLDAAKAIRTGF